MLRVSLNFLVLTQVPLENGDNNNCKDTENDFGNLLDINHRKNGFAHGFDSAHHDPEGTRMGHGLAKNLAYGRILHINFTQVKKWNQEILFTMSFSSSSEKNSIVIRPPLALRLTWTRVPSFERNWFSSEVKNGSGVNISWTLILR